MWETLMISTVSHILTLIQHNVTIARWCKYCFYLAALKIELHPGTDSETAVIMKNEISSEVGKIWDISI